MGFFKKSTDLITNDPGIIYECGTKDKQWWPDAPDPKYVCSKNCPCNSFNAHPHARLGFDNRSNEMGDQHPSKLAAYPANFATIIANAVNMSWRRRLAPHLLG